MDTFDTGTENLVEANTPEVVRLRDGDRYDFTITPVRKRVGDVALRMLAYNGSVPGPTLHVDQGSRATIHVTNEGDIETTVHWHGLRLSNRFDGVPGDTQAPIAVGGSFTYELEFPDAGVYWYHPHLREDFAQEMGLYGPIVVEPDDRSYWAPVDGHLVMTLDDILIENGKMASFRRSGPTHVAMGRFGNVLLVNGETGFSGSAKVGEVVRLYLVNTANTRIFNFRIEGARMKLVGGDSGRYERETFVDAVLLSPSERIVLDVLFDSAGEARLEHRTPDKTYDLGRFLVEGEARRDAAAAFEVLRVDPELAAERASLEAALGRPPDKTLSFVASMPLLYGDAVDAAAYECPMHAEVRSAEPGTCPKCGMKLVPVRAASYVCPMHPEVTAQEPGTCPKCGMRLVPQPTPEPAAHGGHGDHGHESHGSGDGLEWEDLMPEINAASDTSNMFWKVVDGVTGAENAAISWTFRVGDRVKIRLVNEMESDHPMHHPFHIHGAGRFLVLARDGNTEENLVWKDTVLVRAGETVDILLDVTNPGMWMAHCHIAEHAESGMMFRFTVEENG